MHPRPSDLRAPAGPVTPERRGAALALARAGWPVFPCRLDESGRKVPITERGFKDASVKERRVGSWWTAYPDALIGVALPVGTMAVDLDSYKPKYDSHHG